PRRGGEGRDSAPRPPPAGPRPSSRRRSRPSDTRSGRGSARTGGAGSPPASRHARRPRAPTASGAGRPPPPGGRERRQRRVPARVDRGGQQVLGARGAVAPVGEPVPAADLQLR